MHFFLICSVLYTNTFDICRALLAMDNRSSCANLSIAMHVSIVLPKDDRAGFAQEEQLGLPYWTIILAICVVVDESMCLDVPIWEFSVRMVHLPFRPGKKQILRQLLVHRNQAIWR